MDMLDFQFACTETNCCPLPRDWPPAEFHFFNTELAHPGCRKDTLKSGKMSKNGRYPKFAKLQNEKMMIKLGNRWYPGLSWTLSLSNKLR